MMVNTVDCVLPFMVSYFSFHSPIAETKELPDGPVADGPVAQLAVSKIESIANSLVEWNMVEPPDITRSVGQRYVSFCRVAWFPHQPLAKTSVYVMIFVADKHPQR